MMEVGAKVKLRGVTGRPGRRGHWWQGSDYLKLNIFRDQAKFIPADVGARIQATTIFGAPSS
jgi:phospholipid/cholesterol/gamma-HCH transport system substrate-binding protein